MIYLNWEIGDVVAEGVADAAIIWQPETAVNSYDNPSPASDKHVL